MFREKLKAYLQLMRFHKPIGIWLLWFPTAWALTLASPIGVPLHMYMLFAFGTVVMRAAGCVVNDIADREFDPYVKRTSIRPLAAKIISLKEALVVLLGLLILALMIVLQLPIACFYLSLIALFITFLYPFCKRFIKAPQLVLGLAFSMGIPMAYEALGQALNKTTALLMLINFAWIVAYDSMYAMADKEDDLKIGVKSTAIWFGDHATRVILGLQIVSHGLWFFLANTTPWFHLCWALAAGIVGHQQLLIRTNKAENYTRAFTESAWYGLLMWMGLLHV